MRTVSRCRPNTRETSRMLIPSTITARRTRRYTSTWYIHPTAHKHDFEPMDGRGRYIFQPPQCQAVNPSRWSTLPPPFTSLPGCKDSPNPKVPVTSSGKRIGGTRVGRSSFIPPVAKSFTGRTETVPSRRRASARTLIPTTSTEAEKPGWMPGRAGANEKPTETRFSRAWDAWE